MKPTTLAVVKWCLKLPKENILGLNLGNAPGLYFGNFGLESGQGSGPLLALCGPFLGLCDFLFCPFLAFPLSLVGLTPFSFCLCLWFTLCMCGLRKRLW
jgi:hypothetical protein